jgi:hypothetical protein
MSGLETGDIHDSTLQHNTVCVQPVISRVETAVDVQQAAEIDREGVQLQVAEDKPKQHASVVHRECCRETAVCSCMDTAVGC